MSVFFPAGTFYEDFDMNFNVKDDTLYLHETVHSNFTITIEDNKYTESKEKKLFIRISGRVGYNSTRKIMYLTKVRSWV
jgi:hypothetical protein